MTPRNARRSWGKARRPISYESSCIPDVKGIYSNIWWIGRGMVWKNGPESMLSTSSTPHSSMNFMGLIWKDLPRGRPRRQMPPRTRSHSVQSLVLPRRTFLSIYFPCLLSFFVTRGLFFVYKSAACLVDLALFAHTLCS